MGFELKIYRFNVNAPNYCATLNYKVTILGKKIFIKSYMYFILLFILINSLPQY